MPVFFTIFLTLILAGCQGKPVIEQTNLQAEEEITTQHVVVGAERLAEYLPLIQNKKVGLLINHSSYIGDEHLIDLLLSKGVQVTKIFVPEHGYRGKADAGEVIADGIDPQTRIPIVSLYGSNKKPKVEDLSNLDIIVYDIQDVGVRFYTYISSMHYMMESCAEADIPIIVLDRPNPNAHYVDGPVLDQNFRSFVGMHSIPVVYGMTAAELALMINGEKWLKDSINCDLTIIPCTNYSHNTPYSLPIKPSPNLPNDLSIALYPSLCFFEATVVSVGRGTNSPFQIIGMPYAVSEYEETFVPASTEGAKSPKHEGKTCYGFKLSTADVENKINLSYLIKMKNLYPEEDAFIDRPAFFDKLAGTDQLRTQLLDGLSEDEIRSSWQEDLINFKKTREHYLIYE